MRRKRSQTSQGTPDDPSLWPSFPTSDTRGTVANPLSGNRPSSESDLQLELEGMAETLKPVDPRAAERLSELASSLGNERGLLRWGDVDLRRAFNTEHLARAYAIRKEGFRPRNVDIADKIRNVLVLFPILLTWFALAEASKGYQHLITNHPDLVTKPFLFLWQQGKVATAADGSPIYGFGADMFWLTKPITSSFMRVGLVDAGVILFIILLTFYSHGRREDHEDNIHDLAQEFQAELDNALAEATVLLSNARAARPSLLGLSIDRLAERFEANSQELLTRLSIEHERLNAIADRRDREFADFAVFTSGMRAGAEETHRLITELKQLSTGLRGALEDMHRDVAASSQQQQSLLAAIAQLSRVVDNGIQADNNVVRQLSDAARALADSADRSLAGAEQAAQAGRVATEALRGITDLAANLAGSQARLETALAAETQANAGLAESLRSGVNGMAQSARTLSEIDTSLASLQGEFSRIATMSQEQSQALSMLLTEQNAVARDLGQVARAITQSPTRGGESAQMGTLIQRIEELNSLLGGLMAAPSSEASGPRGSRWPGRSS